MNLFQWLTLSVLAALLLVELQGLLRKTGGLKLRLFRCAAWTAAVLAIVDPGLLQTIANGIGIGRGADLVLYLGVLAFLGASFYFYSRYVRLQRQVTDIMRHLAIQNAQRGGQDNRVHSYLS
jgi:hypothetical protein